MSVVSHGCFAGSDDQLDGLRLVWAQAAGYGLIDLRNQGGPVMPRLAYDLFSDEDMDGDWPGGAPEDPLLILLVHHEHQGRIKWQHAPFLADRLEELEARLMAPGTTPAWVLLTQTFIRGLRTASSYRQDVIFS
jgi:hypothetical protein